MIPIVLRLITGPITAVINAILNSLMSILMLILIAFGVAFVFFGMTPEDVINYLIDMLIDWAEEQLVDRINPL